MWPRDHSYDILVKNVAACTAKLKLQLTSFSRDFHTTIDCIAWLLVASLMQIYNEKEQAEQENKYKIYCLRKKGHQEM